MKKVIITIALIPVSLIVYKSGIGQNSKMKLEKKFGYHYKLLDSIAGYNRYDTSPACKNSVKFMESCTKLKAHPSGDYGGLSLFTTDDLIAWNKWYLANKKNR